MAMNWGAFAGGAASSALGTYSQLNSERMKNLQTALFMEDMAEKQQMKQAAGETFGKVGQDQYENINSVLEAKGAEVSPEAIAIEKPAAPTKYTEQQAATDYGMRLSAIDPVRGFQFKGQALQYKSAKRQADIDDQFDELTKWRNDALALGFSTLEGKGMSGMPDVLNPKLKNMGITVEYKGSDQGPGALIAKDDKGKIVGTYTGLDQVKTGFQGLVAKEYETRLVGLLGSADKALNYTLQREKTDIERMKAESEIAKNAAMGGYYSSAANALGSPVGTDAQGSPIFSTRKGLIYADGTKADPKAEITPWNQQRGFNPQASTQNVKVKDEDGKERLMPVQIVSSMGRDGVPKTTIYDLSGKVIEDPSIISQIGIKQDRVNPVKQNAMDYGELMYESGEINPKTGKPFASLEEAQKYAMGIALKDPAQTNASKQLSEMEKIMLPKWPEAVASLGPKATQAQLISLAKQMGIRPELVNLPAEPVTQSRMPGATNVPVDQGGLGAPRGSAPPEPKQTAPRTAIPPASAAPLSLPDRIAQAVRDPQALATLAYEAQQQIPLLQQKIESANKVMGSVPKEAQDRLKAQIQESQKMLQLYQGVLQQRSARTGLPN